MTDEISIGDVIVEYNGQEMKVKDIPHEETRLMMGYGHLYYRQRSVISVQGKTWETTPDVCTYGELNWTWITEDGKPGDTHQWPIEGIQYLVCPKCGLDGT